MINKIVLTLFLCLGLAVSAFAGADKFGYSGRLVQTNGLPVTGPVDIKFDLSYSGSAGVSQDSVTVNGVSLANGVFTVELDFTNFDSVLDGLPPGENLLITATDITDALNPVAYDAQSVLAAPMARIAGKVVDGSISADHLSVNCAQDEVISFDAGGNFVCADNGLGNVVSVSAGAGVTIDNSDSTNPVVSANVDGTTLETNGSGQLRVKGATTGNILMTNASGLAVWGSLYCSSAGEYLRGIDAFGNIVCEPDDNTVLTAGDGIAINANAIEVNAVSGSGLVFTGSALDVDTSVLQARIINSCGAGEAIGFINQDGTVVCESAGKWEESGSDIYYSSGNVGIGTSSPSAPLHIQRPSAGTVTTGAVFGNGANNVGAGSRVYFTGGSWTGRSAYIEGVNISGGNAHVLSFGTSNNGSDPVERMRISHTGSVGIGTTTPSEKLDVEGNIASSGKLRLKSDNTNYVELKAPAGLGSTLTLNLPGTAGTGGDALVTDGAGNLSWAAVATGSSAVGGDLTGTISNAQIAAGAIVDADVSASAAIAQSKIANLTSDLGNKQDSDSDLDAISGLSGTGIIARTADGAAAVRSLTGTSNRINVTNGDGVSANPTIDVSPTLLPSPTGGDAGKFLVASGADSSLWQALSSGDITTALGFTPVDKSGDTMTGALVLSGDPTGNLEAATKQYVDNEIATADNQWEESAGNVYRSSGNVGVGTTGPTSLLHARKDQASRTTLTIQNNSNSPSAETGIHFSPRNYNGYIFMPSDFSATDREAMVFVNERDTAGKGGFDFRTKGSDPTSNNVVRIDRDGNVGVGTTSPRGMLEVNVGTVATADLNDSNNYPVKVASNEWLNSQVTGIEFWNGGNKTVPTARIVSQMAGSGATGEHLHFQTQPSSGTNPNPNQPTTKMTIQNNGNVGIGTTSPTGLLNVKGDLKSLITGTVDIANGDPNIIGSGTSFTTELIVGESIKIDGNVYEIQSIADDSNLVLSSNITTATQSGLSAYKESGANLFLVEDGAGNEVFKVTPSGIVSNVGITSSGSSNTGETVIESDTDSSGNETITFKTSGSTKATIDSSGNFKLGDDLGYGAGELAMAIGSGSAPAVLALGEDSNNNSNIKWDNANNLLTFGTKSGGTSYDDTLVIKDGNVGIGATSPSELLVVGDDVGNLTASSNALVVGDSVNAPRFYLTEDNANFASIFWDNINDLLAFDTKEGGTYHSASMAIKAGNVGIGTTNPSYKLDVLGNISSLSDSLDQGVYGVSNANNQIFSLTRQGGSNTALNTWGSFGVQTGNTLNNPGDNYSFFVSSSGNVGIGTSNPGQRLQVGDGTGGEIVEIKGNGTGYHAGFRAWNTNTTDGAASYIDFGLGSLGAAAAIHARAQSDNSTDLVFQAGTTSENRVDNLFVDGSTGNIGIGTTTPNYGLEVHRGTNNSSSLSASVTGDQAGQQSIIDLVTLGGGNNSLGSAGSMGWSLHARSNAWSDSNEQNDFGVSYWDGSTWRQDLLVDSLTGNVGIGTTSPGSMLDITPGAGIANLRLGRNDSCDHCSVGEIIFDRKGNSEGIYNGELARIMGRGDSDGSDGGMLEFYTNDDVGSGVVSRMVINSEGNVGIGTETPSEQLEVNKTGRFGPGNSIGSNSVEFTHVNALANVWYLRSGIAGVDHKDFALGNESLGHALAIQGDSGNVGIGTTSPSEKLEVAGTVKATDFQDASGNSIVGSGNNAAYGASASAADDSVFVDSSGNVGVGTTNADGKLHISDSTSGQRSLILETTGTVDPEISYHIDGDERAWISFERDSKTLRFATKDSGATMQDRLVIDQLTGYMGVGTTTPSAKFHVDSNSGPNLLVSSGSEDIATPDGQHMQFGHWNSGTSTFTNRMIIDSSGNVGIGTTSPSYKLDVNGTIRGYGITDSSDIRLKEDVRDLEGSLDKISRLRGVEYVWRDRSIDEDVQIGLIAQEVEKVFPELVKTDDKGFKSVNYSHLVAPLIEAVKELREEKGREIASLKSENAEIKAENAKIKAENAEIKSVVCELKPDASFCSK